MRDVSLPEAAAAIATSEVWKPPINGDGSAGADRIRGSKVTLVCGSEIVPRKLSWCWQGWIARGKMQIIAGPPGSGKTTVALSFTATITQGGQWPDGTCHPGGGNVVVWSGEDDPEDTLVPRLIAAGADLGHVFLIRGVLDAGQERPFDPAKDMAGLEEAIRLIGGAELIIVDPIVSAVGGDSHKNGETRRALQPLVDLAAKTHAALLGISHLSKNTGGRDPVERVTGSIAFSAVARLVMIAAKESVAEDGTEGRRILARAKSNIGPDQGGFAYSLVQVPVPDQEDLFASIVKWGESIAGTARDMLAVAEAAEEEDGGSALREAKDFLLDFLSGGPQSAKAVQTAARGAAHSPKTLRRAKDALGIKPTKTSMSGGWQWSLPEGGQENTKMPTPETWGTFENVGHLRDDEEAITL